MGRDVSVALLGPVEVTVDTKLVGLSPLERGLLATLALSVTRVVSVERLAEALWGDRQPAQPPNRIQALVSSLRRKVGSVIVTDGSGYRLAINGDNLDLELFERLVLRARAEMDDGCVESAAASFRAALDLWRGDALGGAKGAGLDSEVLRLDELRITALEDLIEADLALGRHAEVVVELIGMTARHRLRERLHGQLMLALHRTGRRADALAVYRDLRERLAEELGVDPGREVRLLHIAILRGDSAANAPDSRAANPSAIPRTLPASVIDFTGRADEVAQLLDRGTGDVPALVIEAVDGMAGVGKTTLAVHVAHQLASSYPDGQLFIDLHGHSAGRDATDPTVALDVLLRQLGVLPERIPDGLDNRAALWRSRLAGKRILLVLDNAISGAQVLPLLPGTSRCLVLVTSRRRLTDVDGAGLISLDVLDAEESHALLARILGDIRVDREPVAAHEVAALCGYLPLAIRIAGSRLRHRPGWDIAELAKRLRDQRRRLDELSTGDRGVDVALSLSYEQLTDLQKLAFRRLGLHPGTDLDAHHLAALADVTPEAAGQLMTELVDSHLLQEPVTGRYRFHDLVRDFAQQVVASEESEEARSEALSRLFKFYLSSTADAGRLFDLAVGAPSAGTSKPWSEAPFHTASEAGKWLEDERKNLVSMVRLGAEGDLSANTWRLAHQLWRPYQIRGYIDDWITTHELALPTSRGGGTPNAEAVIREKLGFAHAHAGRLRESFDHLQRARGLFERANNPGGALSSLVTMGMVVGRLGRLRDSAEYFRQCARLARTIGDRSGEGKILASLGFVLTLRGLYDAALIQLDEALRVCRESGNRFGENHAVMNLGYTCWRMGNYREAAVHVKASHDLSRELGYRYLEAGALHLTGNLHYVRGKPYEACVQHAAAIKIYKESGYASSIGEALNDAAFALVPLGRIQDALDHHEEAHEIARRASDRHQEARALVGMADILHFTDSIAARRHREEAATIARTLEISEEDKRQLTGRSVSQPAP